MQDRSYVIMYFIPTQTVSEAEVPLPRFETQMDCFLAEAIEGVLIFFSAFSSFSVGIG